MIDRRNINVHRAIDVDEKLKTDGDGFVAAAAVAELGNKSFKIKINVPGRHKYIPPI